jgi:ethanolamine ammonia-lyase large subunit
MYATALGLTRYAFSDLKTLLAKASPLRSGDCLAGVAAQSAQERVAAQMALWPRMPPACKEDLDGYGS